jgi:superfamily II DNA or RNA helicase
MNVLDVLDLSRQPVAPKQKLFAPGARVVIRDEEWLVRSVDLSSDGGHLLTCDGVSELVRGQSALFLTTLEDEIEVLDPANTLLVPDTSSSFDTSLLYIESQRRRMLPNDELIRLGHRAVMNLVPYQIDPALQALRQPRCRILIADAVGLGKTLEAGILATELIQRGRGKRILVVTQKSMLTQFQKEWWSRFSIPLVRLDSVGLNRVRNRIPSNHNPFNHFDRSIISIDTLKNNLEYRNYLENAWWDIIVIDECHNVAARAAERGMSRRARLARLLATRSDTLMLLSATPHDGSARSFASLMALLDPTAIADPDDYTPADYRDKGLVIRRFKKDIRGQVTTDFKERATTCLRQEASQQEEAAYRALLEIPFTQAGEHKPGRQQELQRVGMQKAIFSSPAAALESTEKRIELLAAKDASTAEKEEVIALKAFADSLRAIDAPSFSKYQRLLKHLRSQEFGWKLANASDRLVIFSERIETLRWLNVRLVADLGLKGAEIALMHGQLTDTEQQELVDRFGRLDDELKILLCSDVASEGLNLHYFCHRLVHFDLPWSLMVFQQRNGRVDRYGQKREPQIVYLFTETQVEKIRGDLRILEILERKDEQANRNLGDPASFLNVYDPDKEADKVADFMVKGLSAEQVEAKLDSAQKGEEENEGDWLLKLFGGAGSGEAAQESAKQSSLDHIGQHYSLFESDYRFAKAALTQLSNPHPIAQWSGTDETSTIAITPPLDLKERLRQLPEEAQPSTGQYALCADGEKVAQAIERARQARKEEDTWPDLHYLWPQHPIMDWLVDRVLSAFGRQRAPVIRSPHLAAAEQAYVLMGLIPNRKGQPLLVDWQVARRIGEGSFTLEGFEAFAKRAGLKAGALPNRGPGVMDASLQGDLPLAVQAMREHMVASQAAFSADMNERLEKTLANLAQLQARQIEQLQLRVNRSEQAEHFKQSRFQQRSQYIHRVFDSYRQWVRDTMTTEPQPYIQVLAAVVH